MKEIQNSFFNITRLSVIVLLRGHTFMMSTKNDQFCDPQPPICKNEFKHLRDFLCCLHLVKGFVKLNQCSALLPI